MRRCAPSGLRCAGAASPGAGPCLLYTSLLKNEEIYNIFNTAKILNRPATVAVDSHSGLAGIAHWMNGYFRLKDEEVVGKRSNIVAAVKDRVDALYAQGRNTVMGDDELANIVKDVDEEFYDELMIIRHRKHKHHK